MEASKHLCCICQKPSNSQCSRCKVSYYCSRECQKKDWPSHKQVCGSGTSVAPGAIPQQKQEVKKEEVKKKTQNLIDQDNLVSNESVGTFRWNDSIQLLPTPQFKAEYRSVLTQLNKGWQVYLGERFQDTANEQTQEIVVQPHQADGLSYSMTLVYLIQLMDLQNQQNINFVIMGASGKGNRLRLMFLVEERIFATTNYYEELTNFYPQMSFMFYFVGPELSSKRNNQTHIINDRLKGTFFRGQISEFITDIGESKVKEKLPLENSVFLGYNPGFGSGYDLLLNSWCVDLVQLLNLEYRIIFTQANDYSDLREQLLIIVKKEKKSLLGVALQPTCMELKDGKTNKRNLL